MSQGLSDRVLNVPSGGASVGILPTANVLCRLK